MPHDVCGNENGEFLTTSPDLDVRDIDLYVKIKTAHYLKVIKNCLLFFVAISVISIFAWIAIMLQ